MGLFSFLHKSKPDSSSGESDFYSHAEQEPNTPRRQKRKSTRDNEAVDPVLPEKKRARRRLVGAVALVLAAIIGLPMILDSEPKPLTSDIAIQIPSKESAHAGAADTSHSQAREGGIAASSSLDKDEEFVETESVMPSVSVAPQVDKPAATVPAQPVAQPEFRAMPKITEKPATGDARARALLEGKTASAAESPKVEDAKQSAAKPSEKFVVQVAALATQEKVASLQARLKSAGIKSYTQKVATAGGERIRVRVGPFGSKDEAERTREKLAKMGLNGSLVPV